MGKWLPLPLVPFSSPLSQHNITFHSFSFAATIKNKKEFKRSNVGVGTAVTITSFYDHPMHSLVKSHKENIFIT